MKYRSKNVNTLTIDKKFRIVGAQLASYFGADWGQFNEQLYRLKAHGTALTQQPRIHRQGNSATGPVFQRNNTRVANTVVDEGGIPVPNGLKTST